MTQNSNAGEPRYPLPISVRQYLIQKISVLSKGWK